MSMLAYFCAHIYREVIHGLGTLNHLLTDTLRPLETDLLTNLKKTQSGLSVSRIITWTKETFKEFEGIK